MNKKKGNLKEDDRGWCVVVRCLCASTRKLGLKVDSINTDATRCMPDKERGGSANAVSVFLDVKERRWGRRTE